MKDLRYFYTPQPLPAYNEVGKMVLVDMPDGTQHVCKVVSVTKPSRDILGLEDVTFESQTDGNVFTRTIYDIRFSERAEPMYTLWTAVDRMFRRFQHPNQWPRQNLQLKFEQDFFNVPQQDQAHAIAEAMQVLIALAMSRDISLECLTTAIDIHAADCNTAMPGIDSITDVGLLVKHLGRG